jgi:UDP-N-acetyl-D-glucosamine dehydrogenase
MEAMGVDVWEVVRAAATKPFGYMAFYPGPGIGGDCIPVSPVYLSWRAKDVGSSLPIVDLARANNDNAPDMLAGRVAVELSKDGKVANGARVLVLGIAYKKDIEDTRESPALAILNRLEAMGVACDYHDPYFPVMPLTRDHPGLAGRVSVELTEEAIRAYDAVLVTTDHTAVDYPLIGRSARLLLDSRNTFHARGVEIAGRYVKI